MVLVPGVAGIDLEGGIEAGLKSGLITPVEGMPGVYVANDFQGLNTAATYIILK